MTRRWVGRLVGLGSLLLVVVSTMVVYWSTLASQSGGPATAYPGWVTVLQPTTGNTSIQVRVNVHALPAGSSQRMSYRVAICGRGRFTGYLLAGGASALRDVSVEAAPDTVYPLGTGDIGVSGPFASAPTELQSVQIWRIELSQLPACTGTIVDREFFGSAVRVEGLASQPVSRSEEFGPFQGSTQTWAMPYVGNLPGAGQNLGEFQLSGVIAGSFVRPAALAANVDAGRIPLGMTMRDARPATVEVDGAQWHELHPFQATVQVEDSSTIALQQRFSTVSSVVLGLAGAILTAFVFEIVRGRPALEQGPVVNTASANRAPKGQREVRTSERTTAVWCLVVVMAIVTAVGRRLASRRSRHG